jgi:hypothetical protein
VSWPDSLSDWALPPPSARAIGEVEPVRVFDTAEAAFAFIVGLFTPAIGHRKVGSSVMSIGKKTGGGSRKGKPNKATAALKDMILGALNAKKGQKWLEEQMDKNPAAFMTLLGKVLPTTLQGLNGSPFMAPVLNVTIDAPAKETREEWLARQQAPDQPLASVPPLRSH